MIFSNASKHNKWAGVECTPKMNWKWHSKIYTHCVCMTTSRCFFGLVSWRCSSFCEQLYWPSKTYKKIIVTELTTSSEWNIKFKIKGMSMHGYFWYFNIWQFTRKTYIMMIFQFIGLRFLKWYVMVLRC